MTILPVDYLPVRVVKGKKYDIRTVKKTCVMKQIIDIWTILEDKST